MIELRGKYNTAYVYADIVDSESVSQIIELLNQPMCEGQKVRIMPDVHAGAGCTVGTTITVTDKLVPNLVGVDIGCGMEVSYLAERDVDLARLDEVVHNEVPSGRSTHSRAHKMAEQAGLKQLCCRSNVNLNLAAASIGTLGGGNHFVELDRCADGRLALVVHSGSRHLGLEVAKFYQKAAIKQLAKEQRQQTVARLTEEGRQWDIRAELAKSRQPKVPERLAYCQGQLLDDYLHDMRIVQHFALLNRRAISQSIAEGCGLTITDGFTTVHNYVDTDNMIVRKGAVSAQKGEKLIIPMNMRDGALICIGKGNPEWNFSAPHGAGRLMNRARAKTELNVVEFTQTMAGVYSTTVGEGTLDESPMAYKPMRSIVDNIADTVDIVETIKPVYNFKNGEFVKLGE